MSFSILYIYTHTIIHTLRERERERVWFVWLCCVWIPHRQLQVLTTIKINSKKGRFYFPFGLLGFLFC